MTTIRHFLSAQGSDARLTEQTPLALRPRRTPDGIPTLPQLVVNRTRQFQTLEGFGAAFTEAAAVTWKALPKAQADALLHNYFDADTGHGYRLCRVHMNSCDFALGNYAHADVAGDVALEHFNIDRDRQALLPFIKAALEVAKEPIQLLVSPWSPPAWMKSNGQM